MVKKVLQIGDPRLKAENSLIMNFNDPKIKKVVKDLVDTMREEELIGIAAPQIGANYKIFVTEPRKTKTRKGDQTDILRIYINPKITFYSKEENIIYEGCGSVVNGNLFGPVKRSKEIAVEAFDPKGKKFSLRTDGILGRVIQHEYDHLLGVEFTEKISDYRRLMDQAFYIKNIRNSKGQVQASFITLKKYHKL